MIPGCGKKKEKPEEVPPPPSRGGASADLVATEIGNGLGLRASLAPTGTVWDAVYVVDERTVVLGGRALDEAIALRTSDRGRTWSSYRASVADWSSWGVGADGALALVDAKRAKAARGAAAPLESGRLWLAAADAGELRGPRPLFPDDDKLKGVAAGSGSARPAVLSGEQASVVLDRGGAPLLAFGVTAGVSPAPATLAREGFVPSPFGRPPQLVSVAGGAVLVRPWPEPGEQPVPASPVPGARGGAALGALRDGARCEVGPWTVVRIDGGGGPHAVAVSPTRSLAFDLPASEPGRIGCGAEAVVVETSTPDPTDPEKKRVAPQLVRCGFDGKCAAPQSLPFAVWTGKHERRVTAVAVEKGVVAVMQAKADARWGLYLAQSTDGGVSFELPRLIGEGAAERGALEIGALVALPGRVLMLVTADVTGTAKRGWYVLASDDGGHTWGPP